MKTETLNKRKIKITKVKTKEKMNRDHKNTDQFGTKTEEDGTLNGRTKKTDFGIISS